MHTSKSNKNTDGQKPKPNNVILRPSAAVQLKQETPGGVEAIPRQAANGKMAVFMGRGKLQTKLKVGAPNDKFEKEADTVADTVVNRSSEPSIAKSEAPPIQTMRVHSNDLQRVSESSTAEEEVQMKASEEEVQLKEEEISDEKEVVQLQSKTTSAGDNPDISSQIASSKGGGNAMSEDVKSEMGSGFGRDFSDVKIHTDSKAADMNQQLGAKAFTNGSDVYFNKGNYDPNSKDGKHLLAHELTHTLQQGAAGEMVQKKDLFEKRELTPEELEIKTEFDEYVKLVRKHLYPDYTEKEQARFERNVTKFERKMENGLTRFSEKLKIGTWGSDDYFRLRDKFFPKYIDVINDEIDRINFEIKTTLSELTGSLNESILSAEAVIKLAGSDQTAAENLMIDSAAKMAEAIQKKAKASETLKEYGTDENSAPILAEFDKIIARYNALNKIFTDAFWGIGKDLVEFEKILPELDRSQSLLNDFSVKLATAKKLSEFQDLKNTDIPKLTAEIDALYTNVLALSRTTGAVDEIAYNEEKKQMDQTIIDQEGKVDQVKADEIERRRLAEIERKRKEEEERRKAEEEERKKAQDTIKNGAGKVSTSNSAMLDLSPEEFFVVYEQRAQKYFDQYYNKSDSTWSSYKKNHSDLFLTGKDLADAAKYVYDNSKTKNLKLIAPVELAVAQAKLEGGVKPENKDSRTVINPMNVGVYDGGNDNKKASSLFEIRDKEGWKAARKEGLRYYYSAMYDLWMPDYNTVEEMLEYDHFDKNGNTNYTGRFATAVYYEAKIKAEVGIMRMTEDEKLLTNTVGGGKGTTEDKKAVYNYIKAYDKYPKKLQKTEYSALVKVQNEIPTSVSLSAAIKAIQENEIYPDPSTFGKNKKAVYDKMGADDKKGSTHARATGTDGTASKYGPTIGFLYYHYLLTGGSVFNSETKVTLVEETTTKVNATDELTSLKTQYDDGDIDMIALGKKVVKYCKEYPDEVATFIDGLAYYEDDNIVYRLVKESSESEVKAWDLDLLKKMEDIMTPQYFRSEGDDERAVYKQLKEAREAKESVKDLGKDIKKSAPAGKETDTGSDYIVSDADARVRNENGVELNENGEVWKKGDKYKTIPRWTNVTVIKVKGKMSHVKSADGKTDYGWTNSTNLYYKKYRASEYPDSKAMSELKPAETYKDLELSGSKTKDIIDKYFKNETDVKYLATSFASKYEKLKAAFIKEGITPSINAGLRHPLRSAVFNYAIEVHKASSIDKIIEANLVCQKYGIPIDWAHRDSKGNIDLQKSKKQAGIVKAAFELGSKAARGVSDFGGGASNHNTGNAVDLDLKFNFTKDKTVTYNNKSFTIKPALESLDYIADIANNGLTKFGKEASGLTRNLNDDVVHWSVTGN